MSAGGPIVDPRVSAFIVTSICPFKLGARSLLVPEDSKVRVRVATPKNEAVIVVDGEFKKRLGENDEVTVKFSGHKAYLLKLEKDFYERIRERLGT
jgi:NAD+ kinase